MPTTVLRLGLIVIVLLAAGCATTTTAPSWAIPVPGQASYNAPDGHVWSRYDSVQRPDGTYYLSFTPEPAELGKFTQMLSFTVRPKQSLAVATAEEKRKCERLKELYPDAKCELTEKPDGTWSDCYIPDKDDHALNKMVEFDGGVVAVGYESRLRDDPENRLSFWSQRLQQLNPHSFGRRDSNRIAAQPASPSDDEIRRLLVGTWVQDPAEVEVFDGTNTYRADGTGEYVIWAVGHPDHVLRVHFRWNVKDGLVWEKYERGMLPPGLPLPDQLVNRVVSITATDAVTTNVEGYTSEALGKKTHLLRQRSGPAPAGSSGS